MLCELILTNTIILQPKRREVGSENSCCGYLMVDVLEEVVDVGSEGHDGCVN
jgi:hypothetical protein